MDFNAILNQVLNVAKDQVGKTMKGNSTADTVTKVGGGAAAIGILSMIFGRNGGSKLTKLGSLAALGSLAYQAYQNYQKQQAQTSGEISQQNFENAVQNANAGQTVLKAMIAAAAADGEISQAEKDAIYQEAAGNPELQQWLEQEFSQPASVEEIASAVNDQALAAQVYLAARAVCADLERKEIIFLANLAAALKLDDAFVEQLEKQAGF